MTFFVQGLNGHELMPVGKIFKKPIVEKTQGIVAEHPIDEKERHGNARKHEQQRIADQAYRAVDDLPQSDTILLAEQIMSSTVVTLLPQSTVDEALALFQARQFRHLPIVSSVGMLVGIVSDRDILRYLGGVTENYQPRTPHNRGEPVVQLMKSPVLTASGDTDVRYIARLFVEQRVGALPIVTDGELMGIITRSDVLNAVMRHFVLELWA